MAESEVITNFRNFPNMDIQLVIKRALERFLLTSKAIKSFPRSPCFAAAIPNYFTQRLKIGTR